MEFTKFTDDLKIIQKLGDKPNVVDGLNADQMKAKFDEAALKIQEFMNGTFLPELTEYANNSSSRTDDLVKTVDGHTTSIESIRKKLEKSVDFIVDFGTSGIWSWRKWSSGRAECWGSVTLNPTEDGTTSAGASYSTINYLDLPFPMNNMITTGTAQNLCTISNPTSSGSQVSFRLIRPGTMTPDVAVKLYVFGDLA